MTSGGKNITYNNNNMKTQHDGNEIKSHPININRLPYDVKIFSFLAVMGILIRMIFAEKSKDYATATVYGYSCSLLALLGLLVSSIAISYKNPDAKGAIGFFKIVLKSAMPVIMIILVIGLILYQNIYFYKQINDGRVSTEYYTWSAMSASFILIQIIAAIFYMRDMSKKANTNSDVKQSSILALLATELSSLILILTVLNIGFTGILQVILKLFHTDG
jgi:hypothetical protein